MKQNIKNKQPVNASDKYLLATAEDGVDWGLNPGQYSYENVQQSPLDVLKLLQEQYQSIHQDQNAIKYGVQLQ